MITDQPKIWIDENEAETWDNTSALMPIEEEQVQLPTIEEQEKAIEAADIPSKYKGMLGGLVQINKIAEMLEGLHNTELMQKRNAVLTMFCETFVHERMQNNITAETLKRALLNKLLVNIENLDLETVGRLYNDLHEVTSIDANSASNAIANGGFIPSVIPGMNQGNGLTVNINNATSEGASITNQTANFQQPTQLKDASTFSGVVKSINSLNIPRKAIEITQK